MATPTDIHVDKAGLTDGITGPVLTGDDRDVAVEVAGFNLAVVHRPAVTVGATCAADVQRAVDWAGKRGMGVAVQATGHGAPTGISGAMLITTSRMAAVTVDPILRTAKIAAGTRMRQVIDAAAAHGLAPLTGSTPDVGAIGYATGGGLPILGRTYGFAADMIRGFEIVTADGRVRQADAAHEPDLFWAVRGGKGSFGIVTSLTIELLPLTTLFGGALYYPAEAVADVLHAYREWSGTLPDAMTTSAVLLRLPPLPFVPPPLAGRLVIAVRLAYVGDAAEGQRLLEPMRRVATPLMEQVGELPYTQCGDIYRDPEDPLPFWEQGELLRDLPEAAVERLLDLAGDGVETPLVMVDLRQLGGALRTPQREPNAVGGREAAFALWVLGALMPPVAEAVPPAGRAVLQGMAAWSTGGTLLNFCGAAFAPGDVARVWPPDMLARLQAIKDGVDPENLFRFGHVVVRSAGGTG